MHCPRYRVSLKGAFIAVLVISGLLGAWRIDNQQRQTAKRLEHESIFAAVDSGWSVWVNDGSPDSLGSNRTHRELLTAYLNVHPQGECVLLKAEEGVEIAKHSFGALRFLTHLRGILASDSTFDDTGLEAVGQIPTLRHIELAGTKVTDRGVAFLRSAVELDSLGLSDTQIGDAGVLAIASLPGLGSLGLGRTRISDSCMPSLLTMRALRELDLSGTEITDRSIDALARMTWLRSLDLIDTNVSGRGIEDLHRRLPRTEVTP
jgi:hypothetical protein